MSNYPCKNCILLKNCHSVCDDFVNAGCDNVLSTGICTSCGNPLFICSPKGNCIEPYCRLCPNCYTLFSLYHKYKFQASHTSNCWNGVSYPSVQKLIDDLLQKQSSV